MTKEVVYNAFTEEEILGMAQVAEQNLMREFLCAKTVREKAEISDAITDLHTRIHREVLSKQN